MGVSAEEGLQIIPEESDQDGRSLKGKTEVGWLAQLGGEKAEGRPDSRVRFPHWEQRRGGADLLSLVTSGRTQGSGMKLLQGKFRKRFFTEKIASPWKSLPTAPNLSDLKEWMLLILPLSFYSHVIKMKLYPMILVGPFQLEIL